MDRESNGTRSIYRSYVIDDGWHVPKSVIEVIDFRIEMAWKDAVELVKRQNLEHQGAWLTLSIAREYEEKAWPYLELNGGQYLGFVRELGIDLQKKYGLTELEAMNILKGWHIFDYVNKYDRIKNLIPLNISCQSICEEVLEEYGYIEEAV